MANASDLVLTALMRCLEALSNQDQTKSSKATGPGLPDLILLKYSLERASKGNRCRTVMSMFPPSPSHQVPRLATPLPLVCGTCLGQSPDGWPSLASEYFGCSPSKACAIISTSTCCTQTFLCTTSQVRRRKTVETPDILSSLQEMHSIVVALLQAFSPSAAGVDSA